MLLKRMAVVGALTAAAFAPMLVAGSAASAAPSTATSQNCQLLRAELTAAQLALLAAQTAGSEGQILIAELRVRTAELRLAVAGC